MRVTSLAAPLAWLTIAPSVTARAFVFKTKSAAQLEKLVSSQPLVYDADEMQIVFDDTLAENRYVVEHDSVQLNAEADEEARELIALASAIHSAPTDLSNICDALKTTQHTLGDALRTGAVSFAVLFTKNAEDLKRCSSAARLPGLRLIHSTDEDLAKSFGCSFPGILTYNAQDRCFATMPFGSSPSSQAAALSVGLFSRITEDNFQHFQYLETPIVYIIAQADKYMDIRRDFLPILRERASVGKFVFFAPHEIPGFIQNLGLEDAHYPALVHMGKTDKSLVRSVTAETLREGIDAIFSGKAEQFSFAAPLPENNNERPVRVVNTHTLDAFAADTSVGRFVAFVSPSCVHCRSLAPVLERLGKALQAAGVPVVVGEYSTVENEEHKEYKPTAVPAVYFGRAGEAALTEISGDVRSFEAFAEYLEKNAGLDSFSAADFIKASKEIAVPAAEHSCADPHCHAEHGESASKVAEALGQPEVNSADNLRDVL